MNKKIDAFIEKVSKETISEIMGSRFGRYSKYIIQERALPDVRDGLKPVQRRILYAMYKMGMTSNKAYKKSARIAGEVMGKYHPHGDSSIYDAMVRLSQPWKQSAILIDMHGNNGSIDGDSAAAMRYTEARLTKEAESLLEDIEKRTVQFVPNFDDEELEPVVLPAKFPNILVNGGAGISSGYATKIPPHNLAEVIQATIRKIEKRSLSLEEVIEIMPGPDFPTGGIVQGLEGIKEAYESGSGKVVVRSKTSTETISKDTYRIVIEEIPFEVNKADLVKQIDQLRITKKFEDIQEVRDESDKSGLRIAIDLKRDANVDLALNYLLKNTDLQINFNYNMTVINKNRPMQMGVLDILDSYINHQKEVITNRSNYELTKAEKRLHIVFGLIKLVDVLDEVIAEIRRSKNKQNSKDNLIKKFNFSELQAEAIVTLQLYRLSSTNINALISEQKQLEKAITELNNILSSETKLLNVIKRELRKTLREIPSTRKTIVEKEIDSIKIDKIDLITEETVRIGVTKDGYIKRANLRSYKANPNPGLKDLDGMLFDDYVSTHDTLLMFTVLGNYIYFPVFELEESRWRDLGTYINNIIPIEKDEHIIKVIVVSEFSEDKQLLLATEKGKIKQTKLVDFNVSRYSRTIKAINLGKGDYLTSVEMGPYYNIVLFTKQGQLLRFNESEVPIYGTQSTGVNALRLASKDILVKAIYAKSSDEFLVLANSGNIRRDKVSNFPISKRLRVSTTFWADRKRNPHYIRDVVRFSDNHTKEDALILITAKKGSQSFPISKLKPSVAQYGRMAIREKTFGKALFINISKVEESEDLELITARAEAIKAEENRTLEEEAALLNTVKPIKEEKAPLVETVTLEREKPALKKENETQKLKAKATPDLKKEMKAEKVAKAQKEEKIKITKLSLFDDDWKES
jgi:topoisomerase-4 subunit A